MAERSFVKELQDSRLSGGEGILDLSKARLQSGVGCAGRHRDAPNLHVMNAPVDAQDILGELGVTFSARASKAAAALSAPVMYPIDGAVAFKEPVRAVVASDALANGMRTLQHLDGGLQRTTRYEHDRRKSISTFPDHAWSN